MNKIAIAALFLSISTASFASVVTTNPSQLPNILVGQDTLSAKHPVLVQNDGSITVNQSGTHPTYSVVIADFAPVATATDVLVLTGSTTKNIRINKIEISADATSASVLDMYVFKRTTANTGGTITNPVPTIYDSLDPAPTATLNLYSANPATLGAGTLIKADHYALPAAATTGYPGTPLDINFTNGSAQGVWLHGVNESIVFSLNGKTIPAGTLIYVTIEWSEQVEQIIPQL